MRRHPALSLALVAVLAAAAPGPADAPKSVAEIQATHDRALIRDLLAYVEKAPKADDADQAYLKVFDKAIEHDWFAETEATALRYLAERPDGSVRSLARIVTTMARAGAGQYVAALESFDALMASLAGPEQEEFATNFADELANAALAAGEDEIARRVYQSLTKKFGDNPNLAQRIKDELARLNRIGTPAPTLTVRDLDGSALQLAQFRGKYVLVDFWATWCAPCLGEIPRLQANYAKYHAKGLEIIAVSLDESKPTLAEFVRARKLPWRQVHNSTADGDLVEAFGVKSIPATFLIDPAGIITRLELRGPALDRALEALLK